MHSIIFAEVATDKYSSDMNGDILSVFVKQK